MNKQSKKLIYIWLNFMVFNTINSQNKEGDNCYLGNYRAVCSEYEKCQDYLNNYSFYESNIKYCGDSGNIICCRMDSTKIKSTGYQAMVSKKESINEKKCREYRYTVSKNISRPSLIPGESDTVYELPKCVSLHKTIIGGKDATPGEFPHMAVLGYRKDNMYQWRCGGSLISEIFVMTAAHCITPNGPHVVRLGEHNLSKKTVQMGITEEIQIRKSILHPDYIKKNNIHDIALLQLLRKVTISERIRPACLYTKKNMLPSMCIATGWGKTGSGTSSIILQKVNLDVVSNTVCNVIYKNDIPNGLTEGQFCAGRGSGKDTCQGDSGGPLQIRDETNQCVFYVIGITSKGIGCGGNSAIYTNVAAYIDWIEGKVW